MRLGLALALCLALSPSAAWAGPSYGTGPNQVVTLDQAGQLPAVSAANVTNVPISAVNSLQPALDGKAAASDLSSLSATVAAHSASLTSLQAGVAGAAASTDLTALSSVVAGHTTQLTQTPLVYSGTTVLTRPRTIWRTSTTATGGVLTVYPTSDGTATGTALFPNTILGIAPSLTIDGNAYFFSGATVSADRRTVTITVTKSSPVGITVLGLTTQALAAPVAAVGVTISVALTGN